MAKLRIRGLSPWQFGRRLMKELGDDAVTDSAAQLSYYFVFSLFPLMSCVVMLAAFFPVQGLMDELLGRIRPVLPDEAMHVIEPHLRGLLEQRPKLLTVSALTALWSASRGVDAFRKALNLAYDVHESRPYWKVQGVAMVTTVFGMVLTLLAMALWVLGGRAGLWLADHFEPGAKAVWWIWSWARWPTTAAVIMLTVALAYYLLPDVKQKFKYITPGSVLGTLAWLIGTWGFSVYADQFGKFNVTYGSLGGMIVLLLWLYLSALVFLFGGELNAVLEHLSPEGKEKGAREEGEAPLPANERPSAAPPGMAKSEKSARRKLRWWRRHRWQ